MLPLPLAAGPSTAITSARLPGFDEVPWSFNGRRFDRGMRLWQGARRMPLAVCKVAAKDTALLE